MKNHIFCLTVGLITLFTATNGLQGQNYVNDCAKVVLSIENIKIHGSVAEFEIGIKSNLSPSSYCGIIIWGIADIVIDFNSTAFTNPEIEYLTQSYHFNAPVNAAINSVATDILNNMILVNYNDFKTPNSPKINNAEDQILGKFIMTGYNGSALPSLQWDVTGGTGDPHQTKVFTWDGGSSSNSLSVEIVETSVSTERKLREVFWTHGLGGDETSWNKYFANYENSENNHYPIVPEYDFGIGVDLAAVDLQQKMTNEFHSADFDNLNFAIAHSLGGLVTRKLEKSYNSNLISGYITVGTPNLGAPIANNYENGKVDEFLSELCSLIADVPLTSTDVVLLPSQAARVFDALKAHNFEENVCDLIVDLLVPIAGSEYLKPATITDLKVGSDIVEELDEYNSTLDRLALWGNERSPVHWRWLYNLQSYAPSEQPLNDDYDDEWVIKANSYSIGLEDVGISLVSWGSLSFVWPYQLSFNAPSAYVAIEVGTKMFLLHNWIENSEAMWNNLICDVADGFWVGWISDLFTSPSPLLYAGESSDLQFWTDVYASSQLNSPCNALSSSWASTSHSVKLSENCSSDGLVPGESAAFLPNLDSEFFIQVPAANHQQLLNHTNMTLLFDDIFIGVHGPLFKMK